MSEHEETPIEVIAAIDVGDVPMLAGPDREATIRDMVTTIRFWALAHGARESVMTDVAHLIRQAYRIGAADGYRRGFLSSRPPA
jgi:hypothetical protein